MTIRRLSADLTSREFPFNFNELSSTVVLNNGSELSRSTPNRFSGAQSEQQMGIPQGYYMENVVPISRGFASVSYKQTLPPIPGIVGVVKKYYELRGDTAGLALLAVTDTKQYVYDAYTVQWYDITVTSNSYSAIYVANVKEECYIFVTGDKVYRYDFGSRTLVPVTPTALDIGAMAGMFSSGIILGFWDQNNRIYYSSVFDPLDFVPSLSTGAGSQNVVSVVAKILTIESLGEDIIIYTNENASSGRATGDVQFPFFFKEIEGSEGAYSRDNIAYDSNAGLHLVWTGNAFQQVTVTEATYIWPELRDGITRGLKITLDPLLEQPVVSYAGRLDVRMQFCSNNYVAVSLRETGDSVFREVYVYDQTLQRWGRLVVDHMFVFDNPIVPLINGYTYAELEAEYATYAAIDNHVPPLIYFDIESGITRAENPPGINFAILGTDGRVHLAATSETANFRGDNVGITAAQPRIFLGRYKIDRDSGYMLEAVVVNNLINGRLVAQGHLYSGSFVRKDEEFFEVPDQPGYYNLRCNADSVTVEVNGTFVLTTLLLEGAAAQGQQNFGVPPRKKFYNYINTVTYPVYVVDAIVMSGQPILGTLINDLYIDSLNCTAFPLFGELRDQIVFLNLLPQEALTQAGFIIEGTLEQTLFNVTLGSSPLDSLNLNGYPLQGTLIQTLFPITLEVYPKDALTLTAFPISGTLT